MWSVGWECDLLLEAQAQRRLGFLEQQLRTATGAQLAAVVANWATRMENASDLSLVQCFLTFTSPVRASPGVLLTAGAQGSGTVYGQEVSPWGTEGHCQLSNGDGTTDLTLHPSGTEL